MTLPKARPAGLLALMLFASTIGVLPSSALGVPWTVIGARYKYVPGDASLQPSGAPPVLQIGKDDSVTFENMDTDQHSLTSDLRVCPTSGDCKDWQKIPVFDTRPVRPSQSAPITFLESVRERGGVYPFHCMFHIEMRGVLELRP